eukprot:m.306597 g.306597  ORF g.306597 m.306597 type:complete len:328 (+) comp41385_c0_seq1:207-1190(+)
MSVQWGSKTEAKTKSARGESKDHVVQSFHRYASTFLAATEAYLEIKRIEFQDVFRGLGIAMRRLPLAKFLLAGIPFIAYLLIFKSYVFLRRILGMSKEVHPNTVILPWLEETIFHCFPHRVVSYYSHPLLDFLAAIPYLVHFVIPFLFLIYLASNRYRRRFVYSYIWCAGWVNVIAVSFQLLFPTAAPWFVDSAVYDSVDGRLIGSLPNEAAFQRLDALMGFRFFHNLYAQSPVKFGALPSLHVAWPTVVLVNHPWIGMKFAAAHVAWISWAALYSNHHYAVDALGGILLVLLVHLMMTRVWSPFRHAVVEGKVSEWKYSRRHDHVV